MRRKSWILAGGCLPALLALLALAPNAHAFYPFGVFASESPGFEETLRLARWPLTAFDTDGNGDVSGPNDGIPITFESGDGGWTQQEQVVLKQAFDVWENVVSSYVKFRYTQTVPSGQGGFVDLSGASDVIFGGGTLGAIDNFNLVAKDDDGSVLGDAVLGLTVISFAATDQVVTNGNVSIQISGPAIIDCDILINGLLHSTKNDVQFNAAGVPIQFPLIGTMVHEIGHLLGLGHAPHSNFEDLTLSSGLATIQVDPNVFYLRNAVGTLVPVGVTPTMYPFLFYTELGNDIFGCGWSDLAPDDIAGITYLYPRGDLDNFFTVRHEARTTARPNFPSGPIAGGLVQAWCDVDNNPNTPRVPVFSTITSLYEQYPERAGRFDMINLFKVIETPGGVPFNASYTFSLSEVDVPGRTLGEDFDTTHLDGSPFGYTTGFLYQVFLEGGTNVFGIDRPDSGTPLFYDPVRRKVVSTDTARTLSEILPGTRPMFGTSLSETICPLNIVTGTLATHAGPDSLRGLRDGVLLRNAPGAALADAYYRVAPWMADLVRGNSLVFGASRAALASAEWALARWQVLLGMLALALAVVLWRYRRLRALAVTGILVCALAWSGPAVACYAHLPLSEMVVKSDEVLTGKVVAVETRRAETGQIVTDISIEVATPLKGGTNKSGRVHFTQLGGELDGIITIVPQLPNWRVGEEVVAMLQDNVTFGYMPVTGKNGKFLVESDPETGKKFVKADCVEAQSQILKGLKDDDDRLELGDFEAHLRSLVRAEKQAAR